MDNKLTVSHLTKKYGENGRVILDDFSLEVNRGEFLCILGPSGCGKTTLLRCIAGFEDYSGEISVDGEVVKKPGTDRMLVFQNFDQLFPWRTVSGNITYPLKLRFGQDRAAVREKADEVLQKVGLYEYRSYYPYQLSGGMKQRAAIARALALEPKVILMDEPFASLDAMTRRSLQNELWNKFVSEDISVVFITHNIQEALILGTRILVMSAEGRTATELINDLRKPVTPETEGYSKYWSLLFHSLEKNEGGKTDGH